MGLRVVTMCCSMGIMPLALNRPFLRFSFAKSVSQYGGGFAARMRVYREDCRKRLRKRFCAALKLVCTEASTFSALSFFMLQTHVRL